MQFSSSKLNISNTDFSRKGKDKNQGGKGKGKGKEEDSGPQQEMDWNAAKTTIENPISSLRREYENLRVSRASPSFQIKFLLIV